MICDRIEMNPEITGGKPVVRGTRVPVDLILRKLGAGLSEDVILAEHPRLAREDILAAQAFAADYISNETWSLVNWARWPQMNASLAGWRPLPKQG